MMATPEKPVPTAFIPWSRPYPDYAPVPFTAQVVLDNHRPGGWADPPDPRQVSRALVSLTGPLEFDELGRPLNPRGRTGTADRGRLGKWGPNFAVDPIVLRKNATGEHELLAIRRKDSGAWAIPG